MMIVFSFRFIKIHFRFLTAKSSLQMLQRSTHSHFKPNSVHKTRCRDYSRHLKFHAFQSNFDRFPTNEKLIRLNVERNATNVIKITLNQNFQKKKLESLINFLIIDRFLETSQTYSSKFLLFHTRNSFLHEH